MVPLSFEMPDRNFTLNVELDEGVLNALLGELRIVSPLFAARVEDAVISGNPALELDEEEIEYLATAANVIRKGGFVEDPELEMMAQL